MMVTKGRSQTNGTFESTYGRIFMTCDKGGFPIGLGTLISGEYVNTTLVVSSTGTWTLPTTVSKLIPPEENLVIKQ